MASCAGYGYAVSTTTTGSAARTIYLDLALTPEGWVGVFPRLIGTIKLMLPLADLKSASFCV